jgi:hypothetical protein
MFNEFHAVVKLVSGEEVYGLVSPCIEDNVQYLILSNPIKIIKVTLKNEYGYKIEPWLKLTPENLFIVEKSKLITVIESFDEELKEVYQKYLRSINVTDAGNYVLSKKDGYINNVREVKSLLEKIYKSS